MNFTKKSPNFTKISLGVFRILEGRLEEKVLHIQHRKIDGIEPFCKEVFEEIYFSCDNLVFEISPNGALCIFSWNKCRMIMFQHGTYFIDGKGFICADTSIFLNNEVVFTKAYALIEGCRVRAR